LGYGLIEQFDYRIPDFKRIMLNPSRSGKCWVNSAYAQERGKALLVKAENPVAGCTEFQCNNKFFTHRGIPLEHT
jgi:hypothetical protein